MIVIKNGANVRNLRSELWDVIYFADKYYQQFGTNTVITSGNDSTHSRNSLHYIDCAVDLRTNTLNRDQQEELVDALVDEFGVDFDIILESTHLHIEFDPRAKLYNASLKSR